MGEFPTQAVTRREMGSLEWASLVSEDTSAKKEIVRKVSHQCNSIFVTFTAETAAFPVAIIFKKQHGEESGPSFQFRGILSFVEVRGKETGLGFKCWVLTEVDFISNLTPKILLILQVMKFIACFHPFSF